MNTDAWAGLPDSTSRSTSRMPEVAPSKRPIFASENIESWKVLPFCGQFFATGCFEYGCSVMKHSAVSSNGKRKSAKGRLLSYHLKSR